MQEQRTCQFCGAGFEWERRPGRPQIFCTVACRTAASNARRSLGRTETSWPYDAALEVAVCGEYESGLSVQTVADGYNVSRGTIERVLRRNGVAMRSGTASTARKRFRNGRIKHHQGYVWVLVDPDDQLRPMASKGRGSQAGYAPEHRIVMARHLGRVLLREESVHHRNGIRDDNRLENLELWVTPQIKGQRVDDLVSFVVEYYPEAVRAALEQQ